MEGEGPWLFIMGTEKHTLKVFVIYKVNSGDDKMT